MQPWVASLSSAWPLAVETAAASGSEVGYWAQFGAIGLLALALLYFANGVYARETARSDRLETLLYETHKAIQDKHVPALEAAARALEACTELLQDIKRDRDVELMRARRARQGDDA